MFAVSVLDVDGKFVGHALRITLFVTVGNTVLLMEKR